MIDLKDNSPKEMSELELKTVRALNLFIKHFRVFIVNLLKTETDNWELEFRNSLYYEKENSKQRNWIRDTEKLKEDEIIDKIDYQYLSSFAYKKEYLLSSFFDEHSKELPSWFKDIYKVRKKLSHNDTEKLEVDDIKLAWFHIERIAKIIDNKELQKNLKEIKDDNKNSQNKEKETEKTHIEETINQEVPNVKKKTEGIIKRFNYKKIISALVFVALVATVVYLIWFNKTDTTILKPPIKDTVAYEEHLHQALLQLIDTKKTKQKREELAEKVWDEYFYPEVYIDNLMDLNDKNPEHWSPGNGKSYLAHLVTLPSIIDIKILSVERDKETQKVSGLKVCEIHNGSMINP